MKKLFSTKASLLLSSLAVIILSSCLKDKSYDESRIQSVASGNGTAKVIEIGVTATDTTNFLLLGIDASNNDTAVNLIPVNLASSEPAQEDINVTLTKNDALVSAYNAANGSGYTVPAPSLYTILNSGSVVTIPKGSYTGYLKIKFKPNSYIGSDYALGFSIASVDKQGYTISSNFKSGVVAIAIKNKYDGQYSMVIKTSGWGAYGIADGIAGTWASNIGLATAGASSVSIEDYLRGDNLQPAFSAGATSTTLGAATAFGATTPLITFDPATDKITSIVNTTPDDGRGRTLRLNTAATGTNFYNPATKTIKASYYMTQNGRPDQLIEITWTYVKPR